MTALHLTKNPVKLAFSLNCLPPICPSHFFCPPQKGLQVSQRKQGPSSPQMQEDLRHAKPDKHSETDTDVYAQTDTHERAYACLHTNTHAFTRTALRRNTITNACFSIYLSSASCSQPHAKPQASHPVHVQAYHERKFQKKPL